MSKITHGNPSPPVKRSSGEPIQPRTQVGYYPGYSTLSQKHFWDETTRKAVLERVETIPPIRFFSAQEAKLMEAICDHIIPQQDRDESRRIPIVNHIDKRLFENRLAGYRYENMPPDEQAHLLGLQAIEEIARATRRCSFLELGPLEQDTLLKSLHDGTPAAAHQIWKQMPVHRYWMLLVQDCLEVYYAHPWAWDEIGFGGPAYPRAYMRLERGDPEPWEVDEQRYQWAAPATSVSDVYEPIAGVDEHKGSPGQGGTH
jgi:hypothetical protein